MEKGQIISKQEFLKNSQYAKEEYEGLLVSADTQKKHYNIGVQLDEERIVVVDQVPDHEVHHRLTQIYPRIAEIQRQYGAQTDLQNYH